MTSKLDWKLVDSRGETSPAEVSSHFKIFTPPKTDIWRPSPNQDDFNAPFIYTSLKSSAFSKISVEVSADWKTQFDQGGLVIVWPTSTRKENRWIKTGIEYFKGKPALSVVGCDRFSDWSLCPLPILGATHASIECERDGDTMWVYFVFNAEKRALREIKWAFLEGRDSEAEMWIGVYAAKPTPEEGDEALEKGIEVVFRDLKVEVKG